MFMIIVSSNLVFFIMVGFVLMTLFPSTLVYTICLVVYVIFSASFLVVYDLVPGLMALLIILVYVGAIMVIISYICAVSPNINYYRSFLHSTSLFVFLFTCLSSLLFGFSAVITLTYDVSLTPSVFFSDIGVSILSLVCLFMVIVLMYSTYISPISSSFRSTSVNL